LNTEFQKDFEAENTVNLWSLRCVMFNSLIKVIYTRTISIVWEAVIID